MSCYSLDLRKRVVKYLEQGYSTSETSKVFGIAIRTIFYWKKLYKENKLESKANLIRKPKKVNQKELEKYIKDNPEKTLEQIGAYFKVSHVAIFKRLKKANFTYKKKNFSIKKEMKKEEKNILEK